MEGGRYERRSEGGKRQKERKRGDEGWKGERERGRVIKGEEKCVRSGCERVREIIG